jgi:thioredoxin-like negative regulator of GroEL
MLIKIPDIAAAFGVQGIPYAVFVRNKKAIHKLSGVNPKKSYEKALNSCGAAESADACAKLLEASIQMAESSKRKEH